MLLNRIKNVSEKPSISLVIPCRNESEHLREIVAQIPDFITEIIIVSNASTDDTVAIGTELAKENPKVIFLEDNRTIAGIGYGFAHMTGIKRATGDLIAGADGDGTYPIEELMNIAVYLRAQELDFISCNRYPLLGKTKIPFKMRLGVKALNWEVRVLYGYKIRDTLSGMWIFRKEIREKLKLNMGDWNLSPQIKLNAITNPKIKFDEYQIVQYERYGESKQNYFKTGFSHAFWILKNCFRRKNF